MKPLATTRELQLRWGDRFASARDVSWHTHAETELVAVTKGRCRIRIKELVLEGDRGAIFVLPARVAQYQETLGETRTTYLGFDLPPGLFNESARVLTFDPGDPALEWMEQLCDGGLARPPLSDEAGRALLMALLHRIGDMDAATGSQTRFHPVVRAARAYLEANLRQSLTLETLARIVGASASHLSALFASQCGVSPMRYLQRLRLERACWLLANPYLRIHEVAQACGYEDVNYFTRLFRQRFDVPPGQWRGRRPRQR
ncbi:MAG: AraC family transcriptional regulator [Methylacidiphilales bacterium]|nr:AraC family transcriptional regulator [Candidatus Methylacidiphilales bacterium]